MTKRFPSLRPGQHWIQHANGIIQRHLTKSLSPYQVVGKRGRAKVYERIIPRIRKIIKRQLYRTQAALTGYKAVTTDSDIRVWIHHTENGEIKRPIIEQELMRFTRALRIKGLYDATDVRSEISEPIADNEKAPTHARNGEFYGFAKLGNYHYSGKKLFGRWVINK